MVTTRGSSFHRSVSPSIAAAAAVLGLALAACSPAPGADTVPGADIATSTPRQDVSSSAAAPDDPTASQTPAADGKRIVLHVAGDGTSALVKTLVVAEDGKSSGGDMVAKPLPFTEELTLPAGSVLRKILIVAKYPSGSEADISCSISIDGNVAAEAESDDRRPAECLFVPKA